MPLNRRILDPCQNSAVVIFIKVQLLKFLKLPMKINVECKKYLQQMLECYLVTGKYFGINICDKHWSNTLIDS